MNLSRKIANKVLDENEELANPRELASIFVKEIPSAAKKDVLLELAEEFMVQQASLNRSVAYNKIKAAVQGKSKIHHALSLIPEYLQQVVYDPVEDLWIKVGDVRWQNALNISNGYAKKEVAAGQKKDAWAVAAKELKKGDRSMSDLPDELIISTLST